MCDHEQACSVEPFEKPLVAGRPTCSDGRNGAMGADFAATRRGRVQASFVVDTSGWRSQPGADTPTQAPRGYGLETELPITWDAPGLHFYVEKALVANGYAWIFPCGQTTRFGVGSFDKSLQLRPVLAHFLSRYHLSPGDTHGGVLVIAPRAPVVNGVFRVGDAAGHCLPLSGEGIRTAIFHGIHCGRAIAGMLAGSLTRQEAEALYRLQVRGNGRFQAHLRTLQTLVARTRMAAGAGWADLRQARADPPDDGQVPDGERLVHPRIWGWDDPLPGKTAAGAPEQEPLSH